MTSNKLKKPLAAIAVGALLVLAIAIYMVPWTTDTLRYSGVESGCSGALTLDGAASGRHCMDGLSVSNDVVRTTFAGQGHVVVYVEGSGLRGAGPLPVRHALVRTPGADGTWFCATGGTIEVQDDFEGTATLTGVGRMSPGDSATVTLTPGEGAPEFDVTHSGPPSWEHTVSRGTGAGSESGRRVEIRTSGQGQRFALFARSEERLHGDDNPLVEAWVMTGDIEGGTTLVYGLDDAGTAGVESNGSALSRAEVTGRSFGECGPGSAGSEELTLRFH